MDRRLAYSLVTAAVCAACHEREASVTPPGRQERRAEPATLAGRDVTASGGSGQWTTAGPGFPADEPWVSFYGSAAEMGDLAHVAQTFRIINIDADPTGDGTGNFTNEDLRTLQHGGLNRVLSYLNVGSCERTRTYWSAVPSGFVACGSNRAAWLGAYEGYPDETWMNPANAAYQKLIVEYVAARLVARGVDGLYLDNLEVIEHAESGEPGWCSPECRQGGLDLVRSLRERYPRLLLVMQNATGERTRLGKTGGVAFATLLDGITHEEVYSPSFDPSAEAELVLWKSMRMASSSGRPFFIGIEDYVGNCDNTAKAHAVYQRGRAHGFSPYASDASNSQRTVCFWPF